jgi:uncharacterized Zn finger protein
MAPSYIMFARWINLCPTFSTHRERGMRRMRYSRKQCTSISVAKGVLARVYGDQVCPYSMVLTHLVICIRAEDGSRCVKLVGLC